MGDGRGIAPTAPAGLAHASCAPARCRPARVAAYAATSAATIARRQRPPTAVAPPTTTAPSVNLTVQFATNSADLAPPAVRTLSELGRALSSSTLATYRFRIEGHTDTVGSPEANKALSERRAPGGGRVPDLDFKIDPSRLEAVGMGEDGLLVQTPANTPEPRNRRVQVINLGSCPNPAQPNPEAALPRRRPAIRRAAMTTPSSSASQDRRSLYRASLGRSGGARRRGRPRPSAPSRSALPRSARPAWPGPGARPPPARRMPLAERGGVAVPESGRAHRAAFRSQPRHHRGRFSDAGRAGA